MQISSLPTCWIITLNPAGERTQKLLSALAKQGVEAQAFNAVDGRQGIPQLREGERLDRAKTRRRHLCDLTNTEIGCYLSHLRAIKQAYDAGIERLCVLEDDVAIEPAFAPCLSELNQMSTEVEFIRLMALKVRKRKVVQTLADGEHRLTRPERGLLGTQGYLINRAGMAKVIDYGSNIFEPIDKLFDHFWEFDLNHFGVEPHLVWELAQGSSIQKSNVERARVGFWYHCFRPFGKALISLRRHRYLRRHQKEFYPASRPDSRPGRTQRMKLK